jgi:hypothetical protein
MRTLMGRVQVYFVRFADVLLARLMVPRRIVSNIVANYKGNFFILNPNADYRLVACFSNRQRFIDEGPISLES